MFWGLIMEPQRRYTQKVKKAFHISMAALDISTSSEEPAQVMIGFEGRNYLLCTLKKPDTLQVALDLNFEVGDELSLAANGKCHVHLTGYLIDDPNDFDLEGEEEETEEEEIQKKEVKKKNKKRNKEEIQNGPPVKKTKSTIKLEGEDSEDEDSDLDVKALLDKSLESDDDDETFVEDEAVEEEEGNSEEEEDDSDEEVEDDESSLSELDSADEDETPIRGQKTLTNGTPIKSEVVTPNKQKDKKHKKEVKSPNKENQSPKAQKPQKDSNKKVLQGGLIIEDVKEGQGQQQAKAGNFVTVYYEGRLKANNKMFDATKKGAGFSFKLGSGEVIRGWDAGLVGMKPGGKRRLTIPPSMGYGAKGSPPAIPGNSTLVFDVELKKLR